MRIKFTDMITLFTGGVIGTTVMFGLSNGFSSRHYVAISVSLLWIIPKLVYSYVKDKEDKNEKTSRA